MTAMPGHRKGNLILYFALALVALGAIAAGLLLLMSHDEEAAEDQASAVPALEPGDELLARVNGVPIGRSRLAELDILLRLFPVDGAIPGDERSMTNVAIDQELVRQEAARRGVGPTDADISAVIASDQVGIESLRAAGSLAPELDAALQEAARRGHPLPEWANDPVMREAYRSLLLGSYLLRAMGGEPITTDSGRYAAMVAELREHAVIEVAGE